MLSSDYPSAVIQLVQKGTEENEMKNQSAAAATNAYLTALANLTRRSDFIGNQNKPIKIGR